MADFLKDLQTMVKGLLVPSASGGLGHGQVTVTLHTGVLMPIDPTAPWLGSTGAAAASFSVNAAIVPVPTEMVDGGNVLAADLMVIIPQVDAFIEVAGPNGESLKEVSYTTDPGVTKRLPVVAVNRIPPMGTTVVAYQLIIRGPADNG